MSRWKLVRGYDQCFFHANILTICNEVISLLLTIDPNVLPTGHPYHGFLTQMCVGFVKHRARGSMIQVDCRCIFFVGSRTYENSSMEYYTGNIPATLNVIPAVWCCINLRNMNFIFRILFLSHFNLQQPNISVPWESDFPLKNRIF